MQRLKPVRLSAHAQEQLAYRGVSEEEVRDCIATAPRKSAQFGRLECSKDYDFRAEWNGVYYNTKRVRPIFVEEPQEVVVVTVYAYYF